MVHYTMQVHLIYTIIDVVLFERERSNNRAVLKVHDWTGMLKTRCFSARARALV